jgi:hypothetical protein
MNARLEPRMVAARTQGLAFAAHVSLFPLDWTTASSHGGFMLDVDALQGLRVWQLLQVDDSDNGSQT